MKRKKPVKKDELLSMNKYRTQAVSAVRVTREVFAAAFEENRPADRVLNALLRSNRQWGSRDRQWLSESVFAAFRWWGAFRWLSAGALPDSEREWARLLVGAWQLEAPGGLPEAAKVLLDQWKFPSSRPDSGVTLAVRLERVMRLWAEHEHCEMPEGGIRLLVPEWTPAELPSTVDVEQWIAFAQKRPPMWLRSQAVPVPELIAELQAAGLAPEVHPDLPDALKLMQARVNLYTLPAFRKGWFEVQDLASQYIGRVASPQSGERWWDACAGAGGKSLQLAELMRRKGTVVASDLREWKLEDLKLRARRSGFPNIQTRPWDGKALKPKQREMFDGVLVDVPCSCSGVWRRNPDARWTLRPEEVAELAALQLEILGRACQGVKPGGVLVYATCSVFERENRGVVEAFLAAQPDFALEPYPNPVNGAMTPGYAGVLPWEGDCDGMFAARFRRQKQN